MRGEAALPLPGRLLVRRLLRPPRARLFGQLPVNLILFSAVAQVVFVFRKGQTDRETREERERERERERESVRGTDPS